MSNWQPRRPKDPGDPVPLEPGVVTSIREHPRHPGRFSLEIAGVRAGSLSAEWIADLGLRVGVVVSDTMLPGVLAATRETSCFDKAVAALARRSRSRADLGRWLQHRGFAPGETDATLERLTSLGLLDDAAFAQGFARSRLAARPQGRRRIVAELLRRGVARDVVDSVMAALDGDGEESESARLKAAGTRRADTMRSLDPAVAERRLFGWLARRGFDTRAAADFARREFPDTGDRHRSR